MRSTAATLASLDRTEARLRAEGWGSRARIAEHQREVAERNGKDARALSVWLESCAMRRAYWGGEAT
jgi:hypothetical protein